VFCVLTDQSLTEAVILLQRQDLAAETREVVDEAARLLAEGREGEARALLEKAEALVALHSQTGEGGHSNGNGTQKVNGSAGPAIQAIVAPLAAKLAAGFTNVLTSVLEDIHRYTSEQIQFVVKSLEEHIEHTENTLREVAGIDERIEQLANDHMVSAQSAEQSHSMLWNAVHALEENSRQQGDSICRVTAAAEELSHHVAGQIDATASRFADLEQRVMELDQFARELPPQISGVMERLDGHTETLRMIEQRQSHRVSKLNQVLDSLARLREAEGPELSLAAAQ
jgi:DNA repair ATPase RecN